MPHWGTSAVVHETLQGSFRTRDPQEISSTLDRKVADALGDSDIDKAAAALPNIFPGNQARLREGSGLEEFTLAERLDRHLPLVDAHQLPHIVTPVALAAATWHAAKYGGDPDSVYHGMHAFLDGVTPDWLSSTVNAVNEQLFFVKGRSYTDAALLGALSTFSLGYGIFKGAIPWRGDQIKWKKSHASQREEDIAKGLHPAPYVGHVVGYGLRDPLLSAEMEDGKSFLRHLREDFGQTVLVQRDSSYWRPKNLGLEMNDDKMFINLPELLEEGTPLPETLSPAIRSGAYQAGGMIINGQRAFELFEDSYVDVPNDEDRLNFAFGAYLLRNASLLRDFVFEDAPPLRASVIVPQYLSPKAGFRQEGDSWRHTVQANFLTPGMPSIDGVVVPEKVFVEMVFDKLLERDMLSSPIYIDTEGEHDSQEKAERCKEELRQLYASNGTQPPTIYTTPDKAHQANVSVLLRAQNRYTRQSVNTNVFEHDHNLVLFATTQRENTLGNVRDPGEERRVPLPYKSRIANFAEQHLKGVENQWSLPNLVDSGMLRPYA